MLVPKVGTPDEEEIAEGNNGGCAVENDGTDGDEVVDAETIATVILGEDC